ncbi:hypothetical protein F441_13445 [Phytophthora nicotianae CJ01A1]|uniref:Uncharacterized protein n=3 Tax=Phytophthora nicotianae TaxID=4792 RepID=V9EPT3_PHYNI|nr:hypothetical protein F443_13511 [Phytophthora nicotianae P1569]ETK81299.1 hypothetical protein L915_13196 [Phytophthora nicotianae]ETL34727.1 hypothetical protein L916_13084 [Phytophthora nicotianae]ETM41225.1 hypothetical protein L914_12992 [Phytophthora nicotianae]ETP11019.1 hypothetical protein F441_13445 [Phytophthora nicotianae CJ01A1]
MLAGSSVNNLLVAVCDQTVFTYFSAYKDGASGYADYIRLDSNCSCKIPDNIVSDVSASLLCLARRYSLHSIKKYRSLETASVSSAWKDWSTEKEIHALGAETFYDLSDPEDQKKAAAALSSSS